jgi:D-serine deaminase-like pyridoxal phosphate-dependent protein
MADLCRGAAARLRPHAKTHKSPAIAWMQLRAGAIGITCAKLGEAEVMAAAGIRDILIANQVVGADKIARLVALAAYSEVITAVEDADHAAELSAAACAKGVTLRTILEVEVGIGRCGVAPGIPALELARRVAELPGLCFEGIMGYEGHAVMIPDGEARRKTAADAMGRLVETADLFARGGPAGELRLRRRHRHLRLDRRLPRHHGDPGRLVCHHGWPLPCRAGSRRRSAL